MVNEQQLRQMLASGESDRVERTISSTNTDKFAEAITAFSNDFPNHRLPGYLILGARDDGSIAGLDVTDQLLQNLAGLRSDGNIRPLPAISVARFTLDGKDLALVEVQPSDMPPVRYQGRVHVRVGPRKAVSTPQEEAILTEKRVSHSQTFDATPCLGSGLDALATSLFTINYLAQAVAADVIAENHRDLVTQLASLRFFDLNRACPTNAGILLFGKNPLEWLPGAFIQFLRVEGTSLADEVISEKALSGDLLTVLLELDSLVEMQTRQHPVKESALRERIASDYPVKALRELLMNAVLHRTYESNSPVRFYWFSDRIEIQSPGGLYGQASPENFPSQNSYRNPVLAEAMKTLGVINRFGSGVIAAQHALAKNGNPPAEFQFDHHYVLANLRTAE